YCGHIPAGNGASKVFVSRRPGPGSLAGLTSGAGHGAPQFDETLMRIFIAIELPEDVRQALADLQRDLKPVPNSARWVATYSIHLTLKFLGETPEDRIPEIDEALVGLTWKPFNVNIRGIGFFPGNRSPRVFWAGMEASTMEGLAQQIDTRMERL